MRYPARLVPGGDLPVNCAGQRCLLLHSEWRQIVRLLGLDVKKPPQWAADSAVKGIHNT